MKPHRPREWDRHNFHIFNTPPKTVERAPVIPTLLRDYYRTRESELRDHFAEWGLNDTNRRYE